MKIKIFVMPAWIAGIQVCKDASGNIHVNLDSSTPCWNDAIEGFCFKLIEAPPPRIFEGAHEEHEGRKHFFFRIRCPLGYPVFVFFATSVVRKAFVEYGNARPKS
jgi:hypothetical protein